MKTTTVEVSRENLYAEVWATPMIKLAKKYSLSDVGLRKVCKRNHIPTPPAGYWAKRTYGKKVEKPNLPSMEDAPPIHFEMPALNDLGLEDSSLADETAKLLAFEELEENRIIVPEETGSLHPFTKAVKTGEKLENYQTTLRIDVSKPLITRAFRVADSLVRALDARGYLTNGIFEQRLSIGNGLKSPPWKLLHQLRKNRCSGIHRSPSVKGRDHKPKSDSSRQGSVLFATTSF